MAYSMEMMLNNHFPFLPDMWLGFSISSLSKCNGRFISHTHSAQRETVSIWHELLCQINYFCTPTPSTSLGNLIFSFSATHFELVNLWSLGCVFSPTHYLTLTGFSLLQHFSSLEMPYWWCHLSTWKPLPLNLSALFLNSQWIFFRKKKVSLFLWAVYWVQVQTLWLALWKVRGPSKWHQITENHKEQRQQCVSL